jgi:hypothetical protein
MTGEEFAQEVARLIRDHEMIGGADAVSAEWFDNGNQLGIMVSWPWRDSFKRHAKREFVGPYYGLMEVEWLAQTFADYFNGWAARVLRDA